jgi:hypothetical protein
MTEDEAKQRWCPFARYASFDASVNRSHDARIPERALCLASDCMAWRWADREAGDGDCGLIKTAS